MQRPFTLIEILIVSLILLLTTAVALPRMLRPGRQLAVDRALAQLRQAFSDTSALARAQGRDLRLVLEEDAQRLVIEENQDSLPNDWQPSEEEASLAEGEAVRPSMPNGLPPPDTYEIPGEIQWLIPDDQREEDGAVAWHFYADGQAAGNAVEFQLHSRWFLLEINCFTGSAILTEQEEE